MRRDDPPDQPNAAAPLGLLDRGAILLSALCLLHCLAVPLVIVAVPAVAMALPGQNWVHLVILATAAPLAAVALWRGWRRHRDRRPALLGAVGLALLVTGVAVGESDLETVLTVVGGLVLAAAHWSNRREVAGRHHG